ncbi:hypothetical protein [Providencia sp. PROV039]|nr:hypothetical protein [Providencia sp. PROV039]
MVTLVVLTPENWEECADLQVSPAQSAFIGRTFILLLKCNF